MIKRIFVEKKPGFSTDAENLLDDLREQLGLSHLKGLRILNRYDVEGLLEEEFRSARNLVFSEPQVDWVYDETIRLNPEETVFGVEYLPGQFDQRADSAAQCIQILTQGIKPTVFTARIIVLKGEVSAGDLARVKNYTINTVDSREALLAKPDTLQQDVATPPDVARVTGFIHFSDPELEGFLTRQGLAMSMDDLRFCRDHFNKAETRDPTITEIKLLDTYWSDHCRHTTFLSRIESVEFDDGALNEPVKDAYRSYLKGRKTIYGSAANLKRDICLMDIATLGMKELRKKGLLEDLEESEEINAASIMVPVDVDGVDEEWLVMFKNETHNHPTEIEPFGGAATCLGGAIRDPLSGRSYVYQAMRITGCADPRTPFEETLQGKLPQRKITREAARGYSSYGNQIGLATGQVVEIYHPGYMAKRMEIGAVVGAAPRSHVYRGTPKPGDCIVLVGGRTGRDGIGGATGSSKQHGHDALDNSAEVQKGDPPTERKLQRLFRNEKAARMIIRCNDFGAGGVSVAIGELAPSLRINLDKVSKKYEGLDGTELALSESQERMAVVLEPENVDAFMAFASEENLESAIVAEVTDTGRLQVNWRGKPVVDISREFLDTNGVQQTARVRVKTPQDGANPLTAETEHRVTDIKKAWLENLQKLNHCSQKGLVERFDSTIGATTVNHPYGGSFRITPTEAMVSKIPLLEGETRTVTIMSFGYNPDIATWSPFHGAVYGVVEAAAKIVASGGSLDRVRLALQEYFPKLRDDPVRWGMPFSAVLGAYLAQKKLSIPAIGGKDSMSGSFNELDVPPNLVSIALATDRAGHILSPEFKKSGTRVVLVQAPKGDDEMPDWDVLLNAFHAITRWNHEGKILSAQSVRSGGIALAVTKMTLGNRIGIRFVDTGLTDNLFQPLYGSIILEVEPETRLDGFPVTELGHTTREPVISWKGTQISICEAESAWSSPLENIFPTTVALNDKVLLSTLNQERPEKRRTSFIRPRVFIPVFPGTNCEYDTVRAFSKAGAKPETFVFRNQSPSDIEGSLEQMKKRIEKAQILMLPGGFSAGDEPDGSGKFIAAVFRNPGVRDAVMRLLNDRDGLVLGICNGFQALIKIGLLPYGEIRIVDETSPTLTFNTLGRHVSCYVKTRVVSTRSPWMLAMNPGDVHTLPVSHGEGRFYAPPEVLENLKIKGQIATRYVDHDGCPTMDIRHNPNGSLEAIEGITSHDGRILGKMAHSERFDTSVGKNIPGEKYQPLFAGGVSYFK